MSVPVTSTYRFQLRSEFTFDDARDQIPYLRRLGISHVYCSPILQAAAGSAHGYDVVDHARISSDLGGRDGFERLAAAAHDAGMGVIVDVVPNHVALVAPEDANPRVWALLKDGPDSPAAEWFDVDWAAGNGKIGLPILGETLDDELALGSITLGEKGDEPVIRYYDHIFPVADGTLVPGDVGATLAAQHYRLEYWRNRDTALNYRRFFDVNELIAVRVEKPAVFAASHALLLDLHHAGAIDGFRIDHPDGLADPRGYLRMLAQACKPGTPIWVEKILEPGENLPLDWPCAGTTGYDAMEAITFTLADDEAAPHIAAAWQKAHAEGEPADVRQALTESKRLIVTHQLSPEHARLLRAAERALPDADHEKLSQALTELLVAAPVYRAYYVPGEPMSDEARAYFDQAVEEARQAAPDVADEVSALAQLATGSNAGADTDAARDFAVRLQQTWGPVMAKSVEDTLFYRWNALTALNEVGGQVEGLETASADHLHAWAERASRDWPLTMTTLSTHDTKRSEDVRAAILAISGDGEAWTRCSDAAFALADVAGVDRGAAALVWQTIAGMSTAYSPDDDGAHALGVEPDRLVEYLLKALREAKVYTAWIDGDPAYEKQVTDMARAIVAAPTDDAAPATGEAALTPARARERLATALATAILDARQRNAAAIELTGHTQKAVELLLPGVPDTYQGSELPTRSLVDPDNRRPVDYAQAAERLDVPGSRVRLIARLLASDVQSSHMPGEAYEPLTTSNPLVFGFTRGDERPLAFVGVRAASRALRDGGKHLGDVTVDLPAGTWRHIFTDERLNATGAPVALRDLPDHEFGHLHVLIQENS